MAEGKQIVALVANNMRGGQSARMLNEYGPDPWNQFQQVYLHWSVWQFELRIRGKPMRAFGSENSGRSPFRPRPMPNDFPFASSRSPHGRLFHSAPNTLRKKWPMLPNTPRLFF